jgi:transcriptional regulator GlxA family with amidase domain
MAKRMASDLTFAGVARKAGPIVCANGLQVIADHSCDDAPAFSHLVVTGGPGWKAASEDPSTLAYLRASNARLVAICTGAMIVAAAGLLDGRRATTKANVFSGESPPLDELATRTDACRAAIVDDGGVITSGGVTLGIDAIFFSLARSHGEHVASETARVMEYDRALAANKDALGYV